MKCPVCGHELLEPLPRVCPHCGADLSLKVNVRNLCREVKRNYRLLLALVVVLFVVALILLLVRRPSPALQLAQQSDSLPFYKQQVVLLRDSLSIYRSKIASLATKPLHSEQEYIIQAGDNLWLIAEKLLGDGHKYPQIARDNQITDPSVIKVGQKIIVRK
ncbi:MAG: LysM peptidoglycan-binding domain-containing protein [Bacteroidales bacterium]